MNIYRFAREHYSFYKTLLQRNKNTSFRTIKNNTNDIKKKCFIPNSTVFYDKGIGVIIGKDVVLGENVHIYQHVTLGMRGGDRLLCYPKIEDNVVLFSNCAVLGDVTVGHDSVVGAYTLVLENVPPHSLVFGIPGRVVKRLDKEKNEVK